ncbi:MAG: sn-glycerol-3-phosphate ABC transporter ATP-binding protein UgpC [Phycisphaeraceae bacterium]|nr:sn-glycerol-3-phosphate ABC transporter ATP-binding protein UgpC [Phycisphaeraceae bacterium]
MAQIELRDVSKRYPGGHDAVVDVSLEIADGSFVVLVGPSGCGKSTTLRLIAGLEDPTRGEILIDRRIVNDVAPKDRDIAMVFQNYALYPHMTAYKNMAFALRMRRVNRAEIDRRVRDVAKLLEIEALLDKRPSQMSGGQRQRVAVGRAIVREPKAFLFDEPLSNLDARLRVSTRAELKSLHQRLRTTTVYVTHDQEEAMTLGDRVVVMAGGQIQQQGAPLEVYGHPTNRFVASFIGTPAMNFFEGVVASEGGRARFVAPELRLPLDGAAPAPTAVLGVRPTALRVALDQAEPPLRMRVEVVEPLGDRIDLSGSLAGGQRAVARVSVLRAPSPGDLIGLDIEPSGVHLFEPGEFGRALQINAHSERMAAS